MQSRFIKVKNKQPAYERDSVLFDKIGCNVGLLSSLQKAALENDAR